MLSRKSRLGKELPVLIKTTFQVGNLGFAFSLKSLSSFRSRELVSEFSLQKLSHCRWQIYSVFWCVCSACSSLAMARGRSILSLCFRCISGFAWDSELLESQRSYVSLKIICGARDPMWQVRGVWWVVFLKQDHFIPCHLLYPLHFYVLKTAPIFPFVSVHFFCLMPCIWPAWILRCWPGPCLIK